MWAGVGVRLPLRVPVWLLARGRGRGPRNWLAVVPSGGRLVAVGASVSPLGPASAAVAWAAAWVRFGGFAGQPGSRG
jgi:hypothetical protein